jgi:hypothetical protein
MHNNVLYVTSTDIAKNHFTLEVTYRKKELYTWEGIRIQIQWEKRYVLDRLQENFDKIQSDLSRSKLNLLRPG